MDEFYSRISLNFYGDNENSRLKIIYFFCRFDSALKTRTHFLCLLAFFLVIAVDSHNRPEASVGLAPHRAGQNCHCRAVLRPLAGWASMWCFQG